MTTATTFNLMGKPLKVREVSFTVSKRHEAGRSFGSALPEPLQFAVKIDMLHPENAAAISILSLEEDKWNEVSFELSVPRGEGVTTDLEAEQGSLVNWNSEPSSDGSPGYDVMTFVARKWVADGVEYEAVGAS